MRNFAAFFLAAAALFSAGCAATGKQGCTKDSNTKSGNVKMQKQDFTFFNIVPYSNGREEIAAADSIEYTKRTGNRIVLYSLTLHPTYPAYDNLKAAVASYKRFKNALAGTDVQPGVLIQAILGHWPRQDKKIDPWQRTIDIKGRVVRFCPLDKDFQEYIRTIGRILAQEAPSFMMIDDDIRAYSPFAECFCPLHAEKFSKLMGKTYSQKEYVDAVKKSKPGDEVYNAYHKLQRAIPESVAALVREGINSVDPTIPSASCMSGSEALYAGRIAQKVASSTQVPIMRIANAYYNESSNKDYPFVLLRTLAYYEQHHKKVPFLLDESDTFPHHLYSRSSRNFHTKICSSAFIGLKGAKVWLVNMHRGDIPINRRYTDVLAKNQALYQAIARESEKSKPSGVVIPLHRIYRNHIANISGSENMFERFGWGETHLGMFGIPYQVSFDLNKKDVYLISGANTVNRFSDEELKTLLSGKILLDGAAATAVTKRGFARYIGVKAEKKAIKFTGERYRNSGRDLRIDKLPEVPKITIIDPKAEVLTDLIFKPRSCDNYTETVSPGTVFFRNSLGGHVCVTAFCTTYRANYQLEEIRKDFLLEILDRLNGKPLPLVVMDYQNVTSLTRKSTDGSTLMAVFNVNFDRLDPFVIRAEKKPASIEYLNSKGKWQSVDFSVNGKLVTVQYGLECLEGVILKIK